MCKLSKLNKERYPAYFSSSIIQCLLRYAFALVSNLFFRFNQWISSTGPVRVQTSSVELSRTLQYSILFDYFNESKILSKFNLFIYGNKVEQIFLSNLKVINYKTLLKFNLTSRRSRTTNANRDLLVKLVSSSFFRSFNNVMPPEYMKRVGRLMWNGMVYTILWWLCGLIFFASSSLDLSTCETCATNFWLI